MRDKPFLNFHRTAEAAGYPALLIVSLVCLALVVAQVMLLALTRADWVLVTALATLVLAIAILAAAILAAFADYDEPADRRTGVSSAARAESHPAAPLPRPRAATRQDEAERRVA